MGGPAYNDAAAAETALAALDVPYLAAQALEFQTLEQWETAERGLMPVEATMMVAIPELDGATGPMVYGGRSEASLGERSRDMQQTGLPLSPDPGGDSDGTAPRPASAGFA